MALRGDARTGKSILQKKLNRFGSGHGDTAEKRTAQRLGGRLKPASGAMEGCKGDIALSPTILMENKATVHDTMSMQLGWLAKIEGEARREGKSPALSFQYVNGDGKPKASGAWVAVPEWWFDEAARLMEEANV